MVRTALFVAAGLALGLLIHLVVILTLPALANDDVFKRVTALAGLNKVVLLESGPTGSDNPLRLDPELGYAVCRLDLRNGPGVLSGTLPLAFWSVAVYDSAGTVIYSTTNRDGIGQSLDLGIFNAAQTRLLAEQQIEVSEGLLIVEAESDDVFALVRLAPPYPAMRQRYLAQMQKLACGSIRR